MCAEARVHTSQRSLKLRKRKTRQKNPERPAKMKSSKEVNHAKEGNRKKTTCCSGKKEEKILGLQGKGRSPNQKGRKKIETEKGVLEGFRTQALGGKKPPFCQEPCRPLLKVPLIYIQEGPCSSDFQLRSHWSSAGVEIGVQRMRKRKSPSGRKEG